MCSCVLLSGILDGNYPPRLSRASPQAEQEEALISCFRVVIFIRESREIISTIRNHIKLHFECLFTRLNGFSRRWHHEILEERMCNQKRRFGIEFVETEGNVKEASIGDRNMIGIREPPSTFPSLIFTISD